MSLRVGKIRFENGKRIMPSYEGYTPIIVMTSNSGFDVLSPYRIKDKKNRIMENIWQFAKVYETVPKTTQTYSRWDDRIIWNHPEETHIKNGKITKKYIKWRIKGMTASEAIRYPVGFKHRHKCLYALKHVDGEKLDYVQSRKKIYLPVYCKLVKKHPKFKTLQTRLQNGENLLILEVDGPHQESMPYYKKKYNVKNKFIENHTIAINKDSMNIMLNDEMHPFGHGYCLAMALMEKDKSWNKN